MDAPGPSSPRPAVLVVCTGNACRSQMAEGWLRRLAGDVAEAHSAGVAPAGVHPLAVAVMAEAGVDISRHRSKHVGEMTGRSFRYVITVCDHAREACPAIPGALTTLHWPVDDPVGVVGSETTRLAAFRRTRDELRERIAAWVATDPFAAEIRG